MIDGIGRTPPSTAGRSGGAATLERLAPQPLAAKVPEIALIFWVVKILTTAGGEATSDYFSQHSHLIGGIFEVGVVVVAASLQFRTRRYAAPAYWALAFAIAIFGTGVSDTMHLTFGIPYAGTTVVWAVVLAAVFWLWQRNEGTLSIHSIVTRRRETFYWATVFATFALGTALGDLTATTFHLGYLTSGIMFTGLILVPAAAWRFFGLNPIAAFWAAYVLTRPLGASFADYISKPKATGGVGFGDAETAIVFAVAVVVLVVWLTITRSDIQPAAGDHDGDRGGAA
jgi:uncharacterized membrane-anchored protein